MISIWPVSAIIITAITSRIITKSWLTPGAFFSLLWSLFMFAPLIFAPDYSINSLGLWFIAIATMACSAGSFFAFSPVKNLNQKRLYNKNPIPRIWLFSLMGLLCVSVMGLLLLILHAFSNYASTFETNILLAIPNLISIERYSGYLEYPDVITYSLYCIYPATLLGGFIFSLKQSTIKVKLLSILPLCLAILLGLIEGARTSILLGLVLFFSAVIASSVRIENNNLTNSRKFWKVLLGSIILFSSFTVLFILVQWLRQGMDTIIFELLITRIKAYFFGYLAAFTQWFTLYHNTIPTMGLTTFAGPSNLTGLIERPLGFYDSSIIAIGVSTNIFTALRGLITDFSIVGAIMIIFTSGFLAQLAFNHSRNGSQLALIPLSIFYAFTFYSPLISIFHYNSIIFSWIITFLVFLLPRNAHLAHNS